MDHKTASKLFDRAVGLHQQGLLDQARPLYLKVLAIVPRHPDTLHLLGLIDIAQGQREAGIKRIRAALAEQPRFPRALHNLALVLFDAGERREAMESLHRALEIEPRFAEAAYNLGNMYRELGRLEEAAACYRHAVEARPAYGEALINLGNALTALGRIDAALLSYDAVIRGVPEHAALACNNMGNALHAQGRLEDAIACYRRALALRPDYADACNNLGAVYHRMRRTDDAVACYRQAIALQPRDTAAINNLGNVLKAAGRQDEAAECFRQVIAMAPDDPTAHFCGAFNCLRILYDTEEDLRATRAVYGQALRGLEEYAARAAPRLAEVVGTAQPFFLTYQGEDDRELQAQYGRIVCAAMAARYPEYAHPLDLPPSNPDGRLRIGIVSGYFCAHSNWKIPIKGWAEHLDRGRYELYAYYTGVQHDIMTDEARRAFDHFVEGMAHEQLMQRIARDRPHVLIYPEIGMDPVAVRLAALRLAPVQCSSWGHPETSGLPTLDYFLSSDLMEAQDAECYYTERLVRLPNLSVHYVPSEFPPVAVPRERFGLAPDDVVYFCSQSLFKYLPRHDGLFPAIARAVPRARFVFVAHASQHLTDRFMARLTQAFAAAGLDAGVHVVMAPRLPTAEFHGLARASDVFLDNPEWSGCNTSLEAMANGLPVITLPGRFMRGRHTYAFLRMMELEDLIASDMEGYVALAARLGCDAAVRDEARRRIAERLPRLYADVECVRALERFMEQALKDRSAAAP